MHYYTKTFLPTTYNLVHKFDIIYLSETSTDDQKLKMPDYATFDANHQ